MAISQSCTICGAHFEPQFSYQMEERHASDDAERQQVSFAFFCSQRCLEQSHAGDAGVVCDACGARFHVELASEVLFASGQRRYACSADCRAQILAEAHGARLGDAFAPPSEPDAEPRDEPALPPVLDPARASSRPPAVASMRPAQRPPHGGPRVLAVFNHKGGTGKTTTAVTLASGLAARGRRVLLVDTDGQGNVAVSLGLKPERSLYHVLVMGLPIADGVVSPLPGLDVLPANETLAAAELYLAGRKHRDRVLATRLAGARHEYDYVVVDCSPSLSLMNQNALVLADAVLCPVACDYLSLVGVRQVLRTVKNVNKLLGHPIRLWGVLPTLFDGRARICHEALETLREHFGERCFDPIRLAIKVKEAPAQGKSLLDYAPGSPAARDYLKVVERLCAESHEATVPEARAGGMA
jgi:chromosome partitioning protein